MRQPVSTLELLHIWLEGLGEWLRLTFAGKDRNICSDMVLVVMVGSRLDGLDDFSKLCFLRCFSSALPWNC